MAKNLMTKMTWFKSHLGLVFKREGANHIYLALVGMGHIAVFSELNQFKKCLYPSVLNCMVTFD